MAAHHYSRELPVMPRGHTNVAQLYDWGENSTDYFSVSRLYRKLATLSRPSLDRSVLKPHNVTRKETRSNIFPPHGTTGGRKLIFRDKKALTRGEMEIIEGIYKNRVGHTSRDSSHKPDIQIKSQQGTRRSVKNIHKGEDLTKNVLKGEKMNKQYTEFFQLHTDKRCLSWLLRLDSNTSLDPPNSPELNNVDHNHVVANVVNVDYSRAGSDFESSTMQRVSSTGTASQMQSLRPKSTHTNFQKSDCDGQPFRGDNTPEYPSRSNSEQFEPKQHNNKRNGSGKFDPSDNFEDIMPFSRQLSDTSFTERLPYLAPVRRNDVKYKPQETLVISEKLHEAEQVVDLLTNNDEVEVTVHARRNPLFNNTEHDRSNRRIKVQIYIPTAELDHTEHETPLGRLLIKERPLSHNDFKGRATKPAMGYVGVDKEP